MNRTVNGVGPPDAKICMIGEAPGATEVKTGEPFTGASGELLTKLMQGVGISRQEVYITNVVKEQPPGNNIEHFLKFSSNGTVTMTPAYKAYEDQLYVELANIKANVFVAIGNVSLWALCRLAAITKRRGSILQGTQIGNRKVIPIIHPASALRQYIFTHFIAHDLRRIEEESAYPEIRLPARIYHIKPSYYDIIDFLLRCQNVERVACDIEVMNEEVSCISFAPTPLEAMSIPFTSRGVEYLTIDQEIAVWKLIAEILENKNIVKVGQNIVFDSTFLFRKFGIRVYNIDDTMIAQGICYPDFPKGLDFITSTYTKEPYYKDEGKKWFKFGGSEENFWLYNAKDSIVCLEALTPLMQDLQRLGNIEAYREQVRLIEPLVYMQERGIKADVEGMRKASESAEKDLVNMQKELDTLAEQPLNSNSSKQLQEYFYIKKGAKPYINRKTGAVSVDALALKRLARKGFKEADTILKMRHIGKLQSTYFDMKIDSDNRIRCAFNPVGTTTGRLSSSKTIFDTGGNMQNLPPEMLKFLLADDDYFIYNIDLSQAENRVVAYIAPEPNMIAAFEKGTDIHKQTAGLIFGKPFEEISDEAGSSSIGGGLFSERFWGKKSNHSFNYDLGYRSFALLVEIQEAEAKFLLDRYHTAYPGVRQYHTWVRSKLAKDRILENCLGRKRVFLERWGDELFKEAYAYIPQSTVAGKVNRDGLNHIYYNQQWYAPVEILNQVHDSIVFQIHRKYSVQTHAECLMRMRDSLESPITFRGATFSIPADLLVGTNLDKKKMKGVKLHEQTSVTGLARLLHDLHEQLRTAEAIPPVDRDSSNSSLPATEVPS